MTGPMMIAMILLGTLTFLYRYSFINSFGRKVAEKIPQDFLRLLAPATFAAIIANNFMSAHTDPASFQQRFAALLISLPVAILTKSMLTTVVFGLGVLYALQNLL